MSRDEILATIKDVMADVFDDPSIEPRESMTAADVDGWDSLSHIRLLVSVEQRFGVSFTTVEITDLRNVGELVKLVESKLGG